MHVFACTDVVIIGQEHLSLDRKCAEAELGAGEGGCSAGCAGLPWDNMILDCGTVTFAWLAYVGSAHYLRALLKDL